MQHRRPASPPATPEVSIDLTARELMDLPPETAGRPDPGMVEVSDICEVDPALRTGSFAANPAADGNDDSVEIELTAEQMTTLLGDR